MSGRTGRAKPWLVLTAGLAVLAAGVLLPFSGMAGPAFAYLIVAGVALIVVSGAQLLMTARNRQAVEEDERDRRIRRAAYAYSWQVSFSLVALTLFCEYAGIVEISGRDALGLTFFALGITASAALYWLYRKGDVE
jgi:Na+/melibiose symporter-like transporter